MIKLIMNYLKFIKKVSRMSEFNPFHSDFDKSLCRENSKDEENVKIKDSLDFFIHSNDYYADFIRQLKSKLDPLTLSQQYYILSCILANNDALVLNDEMNKHLSSKPILDCLDVERAKTKTIQQDSNITGMMDTVVDLLDFRFNILNYCTNGNIYPNLELINNSHTESNFQLFNIGTNLNLLNKDIYDKVCFENYHIINNLNTVYVKEGDLDIPVNRNILFSRIMSNISLNWIRTIENVQLMNEFKHTLAFSNKISSTIEFVEGFISIKYKEEADNTKYINIYAQYLAVLTSYHHHLSQNTKDMLYPISIVFSSLQSLMVTIEDYFKSAKKDQKEFNNLQLKIKTNEIMNYLTTSTLLSKSEIIDCLEILTNTGKSSFWLYPIFKVNEYYLISYAPIKYAHFLNLIDHWIINKNDKVKKKGREFENFVKSEIINGCKSKDYYCNILEQNKFKFNSESQEIDLIWETKTNIIIAEVKCIRFPFTSRNVFDYLKTVNKAVRQVKTKADFIKKNIDQIKKLNNKEIFKIVVTNYSFISGQIIDDIPIIDFNTLNQYINVGFNSKVLYENKEEKYFDKISYYNNENEFCNNIYQYITNPLLIEPYKKKIKKEIMSIDDIFGKKLKIETSGIQDI